MILLVCIKGEQKKGLYETASQTCESPFKIVVSDFDPNYSL